MDIVKFAPAEDGAKTEITLSMDAHEIHLFMLLIDEGKLEHLGIKSARVDSTTILPQQDGWALSEKDKRQTPKTLKPELP